MQAGSVFSGIGGFDLAFERAGFQSAFAIERDPFCRRVLDARFPDLIPYGDAANIDAASLPRVDVLHGGFPCQDLSVAGKRAGLAGSRSSAFWFFVRLAQALRPPVVIIENVPGLLSSNGGRDMGAVVTALADCGYGWAYRVLDAQYFGVAQRRRRVFIVGCFGDPVHAAEILFEREGGAGNPVQSGAPGQDVSYALSTRSGGAKLQREDTYIVNGRQDPITSVDQAQTLDQLGHSQVVATLNSGGNQGGFRTEPGEHLVLAGTVTGSEAHNGNSNPIAANYVVQPATWEPRNVTSRANRSRFALGGPSQTLHASGLSIAHALSAEGHDASEDGTGRGVPIVVRMAQTGSNGWGVSDKAHTLDGAVGQALGLPYGVRKLTPRECEALQGFPPGWTCLCAAHGDTQTCRCPDSPRYRALGNAVCVPVAEWIARRVRAALEAHP